MKSLIILIILNIAAGGFFLFRKSTVPLSPKKRVPLVVSGVPLPETPAPVLPINLFETPKDISNWTARHRDRNRILRTLSKEHVTQGTHSMRVVWNSEQGSEIFLVFIPPEWKNYKRFCFDVYNPDAAPVLYELRIGDHFSTKHFGPTVSKFVVRGSFRKGSTRFVAPMEEIAKHIVLDAPQKIIRLWVRPPGRVFFMDNMRLEQ